MSNRITREESEREYQGLTREAESSQNLRVAVADALRVVALPRRLIRIQILHHRLVLRGLLREDLLRNHVAAKERVESAYVREL